MGGQFFFPPSARKACTHTRVACACAGLPLCWPVSWRAPPHPTPPPSPVSALAPARVQGLPSADELLDSIELPIELLNPDELLWGVDALAQAGLTPRTVDAIAANRCSGDPLAPRGSAEGRESTERMSRESHSATLGMYRESINGGLAELGFGVGSSILGGRASTLSDAGGGSRDSSSSAAAAYINPYAGVSPRLSAARSPLYSALNLGAKELGGESARRLSTSMAASPALTATPRTSLLLASLGCCGSNGATPRMSGMSGIMGTPTSMPLGATPRSNSLSAIMGECCGHDDFGLGSPARGAAAMHAALQGMGSMAAPPPPRSSLGSMTAPPAADGRGSGGGSGGGGDALRTLLGSGLF